MFPNEQDSAQNLGPTFIKCMNIFFFLFSTFTALQDAVPAQSMAGVAHSIAQANNVFPAPEREHRHSLPSPASVLISWPDYMLIQRTVSSKAPCQLSPLWSQTLELHVHPPLPSEGEHGPCPRHGSAFQVLLCHLPWLGRMHRDKSQADTSNVTPQSRQGDGLTPKQLATTGITLKGIL